MTPVQSELELDPKYLGQVVERFNKLLAAANKEPTPEIDVRKDKIVVFSDHHKGRRDSADDFRGCEEPYCAALGYYLERGYKLFILGDSEELWEESPSSVVREYQNVFKLEAEFLEPERGGMVRFYGNHDSEWSVKGSFQEAVPELARADMRESLLLKVTDGPRDLGTLFFAHGHQGTDESEKNSWVSRFFVRHVWRRVQRKYAISATKPIPSGDLGIREKHDRSMFEWAQRQNGDLPLVLITGHTHRPVFSVPLEPRRDESQIRSELEVADDLTRPHLRAELEAFLARRADKSSSAFLEVKPPCYFNTGCCSFPDGDITGLEIADGEISLVRWPDDDGKPFRKLLAEPKRLEDVFREVAETAPGRGSISEVSW